MRTKSSRVAADDRESESRHGLSEHLLRQVQPDDRHPVGAQGGRDDPGAHADLEHQTVHQPRYEVRGEPLTPDHSAAALVVPVGDTVEVDRDRWLHAARLVVSWRPSRGTESASEGLPGMARLHGVEFQVLGSVAAYHDGIELNLGRRQERCLLGLLLLEAGRVVSADSLLDRLWQGAPPASGRRTVHTYVARLRGRLARVGVRIATRGAGYVIEIDPEQVDVHRFVVEVTRARAIVDPAARAEAMAAALRLWRGPLLAGVAHDDLRHQLGAGLEETRLTATEACIEAQLEAGQHLDVVGPLTEFVARYPTRERPAGLLMLALHRSGRTADAVEAYRQFRRTLVSELGLDPGPELQQLHRQILGNDPALAAPLRVTTPSELPEPSRRRFLPRDIPDFTGREAGLATLDLFAMDQTPAPTVVISAIAGLGGVGKTALAIRWARKVAPRFPDGQFYLNLRGYDPRVPMRPIDALGRLLRWLDVPSERIPQDVEDAAALYRSLLADQKVLVLLDNARSAEQVRPLLPGNPDCLVVVTSRDGLGGLIARDSARRLVLESMTAAEAVDLLVRIVGYGARRGGEGRGGRPGQSLRVPALALRIAATHLVDRPERAHRR